MTHQWVHHKQQQHKPGLRIWSYQPVYPLTTTVNTFGTTSMRSRPRTAALSKNDDDQGEQPTRVWEGRAFKATLGIMAIYSAILGPFLDGYHGRFDVLVYDKLRIDLPIVSTSAWVPPTFALAGVIMAALYIILDQLLATPRSARCPTVPQVLVGISLFSYQYYLSGLLAGRWLWDYGELNALLFALAAACFALFDRTKASTGRVRGCLL